MTTTATTTMVIQIHRLREEEERWFCSKGSFVMGS
jgi:hypothetical protein